VGQQIPFNVRIKRGAHSPWSAVAKGGKEGCVSKTKREGKGGEGGGAVISGFEG